MQFSQRVAGVLIVLSAIATSCGQNDGPEGAAPELQLALAGEDANAGHNIVPLLNPISRQTGPSHVDAGGRSLLESLRNPSNVVDLTTTHFIIQTSEQIFDERITEVNEAGRRAEQNIRSAIRDVNGFLEEELGIEIDLTAGETATLRATYIQELEDVSARRADFIETIENQRLRVRAGDFSALPEDIILTDLQLRQIAQENDDRELSDDSFAALAQLAASDAAEDRMVVELVRGHVNGTYSDIFQVLTNLENFTTSQGVPIFDLEARQRIIHAVASILNLDSRTFGPLDEGRFNAALLTDEQLALLDQFQLRFAQADLDASSRAQDRILSSTTQRQQLVALNRGQAEDPAD